LRANGQRKAELGADDIERGDGQNDQNSGRVESLTCLGGRVFDGNSVT